MVYLRYGRTHFIYIHNAVHPYDNFYRAKLIGLPYFVKYLNYTGYIPYITHRMALLPLFSLNASSVTRDNYYAQHWNSMLDGASAWTYQGTHV